MKKMTYFNKTNFERIINLSQPHYNKNFPLILFWSPKSGCTPFAKWFFFQIGILNKALEYHPWIHNYEFEVYKKQPNYNLEVLNEILNSKRKVFKLVRNPYKRAVSSFLHLIGNMEYPIFREPGEIRLLFYKDRNSNKGISFKHFLYYLRRVGPKPGVINGHFAQQYIDGEEYLIKNYIYLENFDNHISKIEESYGLVKSPLEIINKSGHYFSSRMILTGDYSKIAFAKLNKLLPTYHSFYDKETKDLVREVFKKDFEVYGYKNISF